MITVILAFVFIILCGGCVAAAVLMYNNAHNKKAKEKVAFNKRTFIALIACACVAFVAFVTIPFSFHTVQPGQAAVVKVWGDAKYSRSSGTYFDFWVSHQYDIYDATVQQDEIRTMCYSLDAQTMNVSLVVQYQIQEDKVCDIARNYNGLEQLTKRIEAVSIDKAKTVLSQKSAMTIIETRSSVSPDIERVIKDAIAEGYYVDIVAVVITNIDFSDAFEATVEDKMIAEQQQLKAEFEKQKAIIEAQKELEVAKLAAEANIAKAQGEAEAVLVKAQAEANSLKLKSIEVARMLGFTIVETVTDDGVMYDIDFQGKSDAEIKLISDYLKYIAYLDAWDGVLPLVTDGGANVIVPINP